jgi:hypothetical protein
MVLALPALSFSPPPPTFLVTGSSQHGTKWEEARPVRDLTCIIYTCEVPPLLVSLAQHARQHARTTTCMLGCLLPCMPPCRYVTLRLHRGDMALGSEYRTPTIKRGGRDPEWSPDTDPAHTSFEVSPPNIHALLRRHCHPSLRHVVSCVRRAHTIRIPTTTIPRCSCHIAVDARA